MSPSYGITDQIYTILRPQSDPQGSSTPNRAAHRQQGSAPRSLPPPARFPLPRGPSLQLLREGGARGADPAAGGSRQDAAPPFPHKGRAAGASPIPTAPRGLTRLPPPPGRRRAARRGRMARRAPLPPSPPHNPHRTRGPRGRPGGPCLASPRRVPPPPRRRRPELRCRRPGPSAGRPPRSRSRPPPGSQPAEGPLPPRPRPCPGLRRRLRRWVPARRCCRGRRPACSSGAWLRAWRRPDSSRLTPGRGGGSGGEEEEKEEGKGRGAAASSRVRRGRAGPGHGAPRAPRSGAHRLSRQRGLPRPQRR